MTSDIPKAPDNEITPRQALAFSTVGSGADLDLRHYKAFSSLVGTELGRKMRKRIKQLSGHTPRELHAMAPKVTFGSTRECARTRARIRTQILDGLPFMEKYKKSERESGLREVGLMANDYINRIIAKYMGGIEQLNMNNEVEMCNDAAQLLLMSFNDKLAAKVKFEASRKLLLMQYLGETRDYSEKEVDHDEAMQYMFGFFNEEIFEVPEDARIGETFERYLVSRHDPFDLDKPLEDHDFEAHDSEFLEGLPERDDLEALDRVTPLQMRRTVVTDKSGKKREIYFGLEPREKTVESRLTKALRYDSKIGEKDVDRNGIRLVFENREDWEDFFSSFVGGLEYQIATNFEEQLDDAKNKTEREVIESRIRGENVLVYDDKDSLDGSPFNGNDVASSDKLKVFKFKLRVARADHRIHKYEFQVFLPDGYADIMYRKGVSNDEYDVDRFFARNVDQILFPDTVYEGIDRSALHATMMKQAHRKNWNGHANVSDGDES